MGPTPGRGRSRQDTANQSNAWRRSQGGVVTVGVIRATWAGWPVTSDPGLKVRQFVVSVNGQSVLSLDYRTVSDLILTGPRTVVMEVMEEPSC
ncbi:unnamed protein product [Boreogadus saida]